MFWHIHTVDANMKIMQYKNYGITTILYLKVKAIVLMLRE